MPECHDNRAVRTARHELGDVCQHGTVGGQSLGLRSDREVVEDGDLKSIPSQLPQLPSPEGRDASLEAGDWTNQLEPLVDLWWATSSRTRSVPG